MTYLALWMALGLLAFRPILRLIVPERVGDWSEVFVVVGLALVLAFVFGVPVAVYLALSRGLDRVGSPTETLYALSGESEEERLGRRRRAAERREIALRAREKQLG